MRAACEDQLTIQVCNGIERERRLKCSMEAKAPLHFNEGLRQVLRTGGLGVADVFGGVALRRLKGDRVGGRELLSTEIEIQRDEVKTPVVFNQKAGRNRARIAAVWVPPDPLGDQNKGQFLGVGLGNCGDPNIYRADCAVSDGTAGFLDPILGCCHIG